MADPKDGGPAKPAKAADVGDTVEVEVGKRPSPIVALRAMNQLVFDLALAPHHIPPKGATVERKSLIVMVESLVSVLNFLIALNVPTDARQSLDDVLTLVAKKARAPNRPPIDLVTVLEAVRRLTDAGMTEPNAIKDVAAALAGIRGVSDHAEFLKRLKRQLKAQGPLQDHKRRDWNVAEAQEINGKLLRLML